MSYCRWSTDGHRCDIYAYQSARGYEVHVVSQKKDVPALWSDPMRLFLKGDAHALEEYRSWHEEYDKLPFVKVTAPSAGQHFTLGDLESFKAKILELRAEGLRFPDGVLEEIDDEIAENPEG